MKLFRVFAIGVAFIGTWHLFTFLSGIQPFILPSPVQVGAALVNHFYDLIGHTLTTFIEIMLGLIFGTILGALCALVMIVFRSARIWLLPILVTSQAVPVFALAPILVIWLGYGMTSKIAMATLIIFFPVTAAMFDGLRQTKQGFLDLANTMNASRWAALIHVRIPAALPSFASGLRVATAVAPIGAIVGEWVGSSEGLGFMMLHANARMQIDLMFAALFILAIMAVTLYFIIDQFLQKFIVPHYY